jgi:Outer membrane protein beta-barrel domain
MSFVQREMKWTSTLFVVSPRRMCIGMVWILLSGLLAHDACAQKSINMDNLPKFDSRFYHFGFLLSYNQSSFYIDRKLNTTFGDSLLAIDNVPQAGFNLALMASLNMTKNINLRFVPGLSFQDRGLNYRFLEPNGTINSSIKRTESVWLEFPLLIKWRTNRVGNFAAYALTGAKYSIDMQSQKDVSNTVAKDIVVKLENKDICVEAGGGFDFFLPYFKFSLELKTAFGMQNLIIQENNIYTSPIESLRTRSFVFSLCFEG